MNPSSNFLSYRATLKAAILRSEGATDQIQRIIIPFFSLLVKDLLVVNEASLIKVFDRGKLGRQGTICWLKKELFMVHGTLN